MALPTSCKMLPLAILVFVFLLAPSALAAVICEELSRDQCAFAISSSSKRCVLESYQRSGASTEYLCRTSEVVVDHLFDHIEDDQCVKTCGVDRNSIGISSDALLEPMFTEKLCSPNCFQNCANIIDLYYNLAAGEGVFLPDLCQARRFNPHRAMIELMSSGAAPDPISSGNISRSGPSFASSPAPSPF